MMRDLCRLLLSQGPRLVYTATRETGEALEGLRAEFPGVAFETAANEKQAYELALAGAYAAKRTACLFPARGLFEAMDPLMSSAYTGVKGACLILCYKEDEEDISPISLFSKLPLLTANGLTDLSSLLPFAYDISERYEIPCLVETLTGGRAPKATKRAPAAATVSRFLKNPARWAATPEFRHELHETLNEKTEQIRKDFEAYTGNEQVLRGRTGIITHKAAGYADPGGEMSLLRLGTVFPLPVKTVEAFTARMDKVTLHEGPYPVLEMQMRERSRIEGRLLPSGGSSPKGKKRPPVAGERLGVYRVVRDMLGPASSINMAHGMAASVKEDRFLAITNEDAFFHSGLPAFVNTLYNGSAYLLLIEVRERKEEIERVLGGFGFSEVSSVETREEIEGFQAKRLPAVLLYKGELA